MTEITKQFLESFKIARSQFFKYWHNGQHDFARTHIIPYLKVAISNAGDQLSYLSSAQKVSDWVDESIFNTRLYYGAQAKANIFNTELVKMYDEIASGLSLLNYKYLLFISDLAFIKLIDKVQAFLNEVEKNKLYA